MGIIMRNRKCYTGKVKEQPVYSTDEQCIGYIDINGTQKKLYQKTYTGTFGTLTKGAWSSVTITTFPETSYRLQHYEGWANHTTGRVMIPYCLARPTAEQLFMVNQTFTGTVAIGYYMASATNYDNCDWQVTLQYTKD